LQYCWNITRKLGIDRRWFRVLYKDDIEVFVFYLGRYKVVMELARNYSQQKMWKRRGVKRVVLAVDLDEKDIDEKLKAIEDSLKSTYTTVERMGYSFRCKHNGEEYNFTVIMLGDPSLQKRIDVKQEKFMIEDIIINLALENENFKEICLQCIELFKHKKGEKKPNQKSIFTQNA